MKRRQLVWLLILLTFLAGCNGSYSSGDRVLVDKDLFDTGLKKPERFNVVVFRCPEPPQRGGPLDNFIKRLLGLGSETLAIFFGHLFVTTDWQPPTDLDAGHLALDPTKADPLELWRPKYMYRDDANARDLFKLGQFTPRGASAAQFGKFQIIRKTPPVMLALSRIVYDNDHPATDLVKAGFPARWNAPDAGAWTAVKDHGFQDTGKGENIRWLHYKNILRPLDWPSDDDPAVIADIMSRPHPAQLITDFSGYNTYEPGGMRRELASGNWVGDLMLDFELTVERPEGELWLELARAVDRFQMCLDLSTGKCTLYRIQDGKHPQELASATTTVSKAGTYRLRFANYDERLTVWVDGSLPFQAGVEYRRSWYFDPTRGSGGAFVNTGPTKNDLKPASIGSKGAAVTLHHLRLWRNTYYTIGTDLTHTTCDASLPPAPDRLNDVSSRREQEAAVAIFWEKFWSSPTEWGPLHQLDFSTLYVQKGHYLCLGDNSTESHDSRAWGTVPERLMLGRALMVYYPFSRAGFIR
jgi:hypothetical protein